MYKYLHFILTTILITACASTATMEPASSTSSPATGETAGISVQVDEAKMLIVEVKEGRYYATQVVETKEEAEKDALAGQYHTANDGSRFVQITLKVLEGADPKEVYEWKIQLRDSQGTLYEAAIRSSGLFAGGADSINWIFVVPNENKAAALIFPGDISVDLESLIQEE